jgi:hypothetical protein
MSFSSRALCLTPFEASRLVLRLLGGKLDPAHFHKMRNVYRVSRLLILLAYTKLTCTKICYCICVLVLQTDLAKFVALFEPPVSTQ